MLFQSEDINRVSFVIEGQLSGQVGNQAPFTVSRQRCSELLSQMCGRAFNTCMFSPRWATTETAFHSEQRRPEKQEAALAEWECHLLCSTAGCFLPGVPNAAEVCLSYTPPWSSRVRMQQSQNTQIDTFIWNLSISSKLIRLLTLP